VTATLKAILLTMAAMAVFTTLDACAKLVTQTLEPWVAVYFRYTLACLLSLPVLLMRHRARGFRTRHPWLQLIRGFLLLLSTILNFNAMAYLQLSTTAAIFFTIPLFVSLLSGPLLGENVGLKRWIAVLAGFCGVLIIMRPGTESFHWAMFFSLGASFAGSLYNIATRKVAGHDSVETSLFYVGLFGAAIAAIPAAADWQWPSVDHWPLLLLMGLAHRLAPASRIAPFIYSQIIWMTVAGYLVFGDVPEVWTFVGAVVVVMCGLYLLNSERQKNQPLPVPED
jgi:drug/metabolite transporter (DMT)-like permease